MPKEDDQARLTLLARILLGAIGTVSFERRAFIGSAAEPDDVGLNALVGTQMPIEERKAILRDAITEHLRTGGAANRVEVGGNIVDRLDPELRYEFRLKLAGVNVYIKTVLELDDADWPMLIIKKVARKN